MKSLEILWILWWEEWKNNLRMNQAESPVIIMEIIGERKQCVPREYFWYF